MTAYQWCLLFKTNNIYSLYHFLKWNDNGFLHLNVVLNPPFTCMEVSWVSPVILSDVMALFEEGCQIMPDAPTYTLSAKKDKRKARWKHLYFTFSFAGNGLTPTINNYCGFTVTLTRSVMDEKCNMQCAKLKIHNIRTGVCHFLMLCLKCSTASRVSIITLWIYENVMCVWVQEGSLSETYQFYVVLEIVKLD